MTQGCAAHKEKALQGFDGVDFRRIIGVGRISTGLGSRTGSHRIAHEALGRTNRINAQKIQPAVRLLGSFHPGHRQSVDVRHAPNLFAAVVGEFQQQAPARQILYRERCAVVGVEMSVQGLAPLHQKLNVPFDGCTVPHRFDQAQLPRLVLNTLVDLSPIGRFPIARATEHEEFWNRGPRRNNGHRAGAAIKLCLLQEKIRRRYNNHEFPLAAGFGQAGANVCRRSDQKCFVQLGDLSGHADHTCRA
jgi:hypothetical protein